MARITIINSEMDTREMILTVITVIGYVWVASYCSCLALLKYDEVGLDIWSSIYDDQASIQSRVFETSRDLAVKRLLL